MQPAFLIHKGSTAVWGSAALDLEQYGFRVSVRSEGIAYERDFIGDLDSIAERLVQWLVQHELCHEVTPPTWYRIPSKQARFQEYCQVLEAVLLQLLARQGNRSIAKLDSETHEATVVRALKLARGEDTPYQVQMLFLASAIYAKRCDALPDSARDYTIELVTGGDLRNPHRLWSLPNSPATKSPARAENPTGEFQDHMRLGSSACFWAFDRD